MRILFVCIYTLTILFSKVTNGQSNHYSSFETAFFATPSPATGVASVVFTYDGVIFNTENRAPYSLANDKENNGIIDYFSWTPAVGTHSLKVTAYSSRNGSGTALSSLTITFRVV